MWPGAQAGWSSVKLFEAGPDRREKARSRFRPPGRNLVGKLIEERAVVEPFQALAGEHLPALLIFTREVEQQPELGHGTKVAKEVCPVSLKETSEFLTVEGPVLVLVVPDEQPVEPPLHEVPLLVIDARVACVLAGVDVVRVYREARSPRSRRAERGVDDSAEHHRSRGAEAEAPQALVGLEEGDLAVAVRVEEVDVLLESRAGPRIGGAPSLPPLLFRLRIGLRLLHAPLDLVCPLASRHRSISSASAVMIRDPHERFGSNSCARLLLTVTEGKSRGTARYSVVLPSKCSLSAPASARVWWTTPSRRFGGAY